MHRLSPSRSHLICLFASMVLMLIGNPSHAQQHGPSAKFPGNSRPGHPAGGRPGYPPRSNMGHPRQGEYGYSHGGGSSRGGYYGNPQDGKHRFPRDGEHGYPPGGNFWGGVGIGPIFFDSGFGLPPHPQFSSRGSYALINMPQGEAFPPNFIAGNTHASSFVERAEAAFRTRSHEDAYRWLQHAQIEEPQNAWLKLFEAEALLALGNYDVAADAVTQGLSQLQPVPWRTIAENHRLWYENGDYNAQMSRLDEFIRQHGRAERTLFLRGYHAAFQGDPTAAISDLQQVLLLKPDHFAAADLLRFLGASQPATEVIAPEAVITSEKEAELLPPAQTLSPSRK